MDMDTDTEHQDMDIMRKNKTSKLILPILLSFSFFNPFIFISFTKNLKV